MKKIVILDYHSREVFVIEDSPMFYDEGDFDVESMLDYLSEEHDIYLRTDDIHWMITDNATINVL